MKNKWQIDDLILLALALAFLPVAVWFCCAHGKPPMVPVDTPVAVQPKR
jgi:hypothetical protein